MICVFYFSHVAELDVATAHTLARMLSAMANILTDEIIVNLDVGLPLCSTVFSFFKFPKLKYALRVGRENSSNLIS
jgi:hypothetical protein